MDDAFHAAWEKCCAEVPDDAERLRGHLTEFVALVSGGDPGATARFFNGLWPDDDWEWPWLEEWRDRFAREGVAPMSWAERDRWPWRSVRTFQFGGTAMRRAGEEREWRQTVQLLSYRGNWKPGMPFPVATSMFAGWRLVPWDGDPPGVAEACFERFLAGDHDYRPPYFPLDSSRIELFTRRQAERWNLTKSP